jgi:PIN domain nuclease of toxin-antitoxin system
MLIAQASIESLTLLTADNQQAAYGVPVILA